MRGLSSSLFPQEPSLVRKVCALFNDTCSLQVFIPTPELSSKKALPQFFNGHFLWLQTLCPTEYLIFLTSGHHQSWLLCSGTSQVVLTKTGLAQLWTLNSASLALFLGSQPPPLSCCSQVITAVPTWQLCVCFPICSVPLP